MWNLLKARMNERKCNTVRDALENTAEAAVLSAAQRAHLAACAECQTAAEDILATRNILAELPARAAEPGPWFAPRVMAAIAARESELRQTLEAWAAVPRLAARLTWLSALALLLASTWLYQLPKFTPNSSNGGAAESLFDSPQSSATPDDIVLPMENAQ